jgi:hypothetical protein
MVLLWSVQCKHGEPIVSSPEDNRIAATACNLATGAKLDQKRRAVCTPAHRAPISGADTLRSMGPAEALRINAFGGIEVNAAWVHVLPGISAMQQFKHLPPFSSGVCWRPCRIVRGIRGASSVKNGMELKYFRPQRAAASDPAAGREDIAAAFTRPMLASAQTAPHDGPMIAHYFIMRRTPSCASIENFSFWV